MNLLNYNIYHKCRYHKDEDIFLKTDNVSDNEKDMIRYILYKDDLLQIFNTNENDDIFQELDNYISYLFELVLKSEPLCECMKIVASNKLMTENKELGLCLLYSYDYMYATHACVSDYLQNRHIKEENIQQLKKLII